MASTIQRVELKDDRQFVNFLVDQSAWDAEFRATMGPAVLRLQDIREKVSIATRTLIFLVVVAFLWVLGRE